MNYGYNDFARYIANESYNKFTRTKSICETIDDNAVHIKKDRCKNGIICFFTDRYCCAISDCKEVDGVPLFLLIKEFQNQTKDINPYEHWTHLIGKQIKKDEGSKYFVQPTSLHFNNGRFDKNNDVELNKLVVEAKRLFTMV